jgi:two-component system, OmpR family, phosphate regulon response regulator PhoB
MTKGTIMVVQDDRDTVELVQSNLKAAGYKVVHAASAEKALQKSRTQLPQLIVLDVAVPEIDGFELCKILKREPTTAQIPIIILTARATEVDRILALEFGADEYMIKPFNPRELFIRVDRLLKRQQPAPLPDHAQHYTLGILSIDIPRHEVTVGGKAIGLTPIEFKLLTVLAQRRERVQSRDQLLHDVWGYDTDAASRTVDTHMRRLRSKLGRAAKRLHTVRGFGYRFVD